VSVTSFPVPMRQRRHQVIPVPVFHGLGDSSSSGNQSGLQEAASASQIVASLVSIGVMLANVFKGCGQTCIEAADLANQAEPLLLQNLQAYLAAPVHYASVQAAALANFANTWNSVTTACSNPALGSAGQACIGDRQAGACHYQTSPGGWQQAAGGNWSYQYPGAQGSGSTCWNWFVGYHDPIANDPTVVPDPVPGAAIASSLLSSVGIPADATVFGLPVGDVAIGGLALLLAWMFL
jgi:hypothetical protein